MAAKTGSRNGLKFGWALGENNWNVGMDGNLSFIDRFGLHLSFKSFLNTPPGSPAAGDCYVIDAAPTDAWVGKTGQVAVYDDGAWRYGIPRTGWQAYCEADGEQYVFDGGWSIASGGPDVMAAKTIKGNKNAVSSAPQDLTPSEARTVMELGTAAVADTGTGPSNVILGNDARLSDAREWTAGTVAQADAEAGTATTRRAWTAQRVRQAIAAWWLTASSAFGRTLANVADAAAGRTALGLGSAATATVTTSAADTTAGRLLKVGDFGLGGEPQTITGSWNDLTGESRLIAGALNATTDGPFSGPSWLQGLYVKHSSGNGTFFGSVISTTNPRAFVRIRLGGVWQPWVEIVKNGDSPTFAGSIITADTTTPALTITQTGTGDCLRVEDSASPDSTPFIVRGDGNVSIGGVGSRAVSFFNQGVISGDTTAFANYTVNTIASDVTGLAYGWRTNIGTVAAPFNLSTLYHYQAAQAVIGAGSSITNQIGFSASNNLGGATNNYGFKSDLSAATGCWNFYAAGTAPNYFAGDVGVGLVPTVRNNTRLQIVDGIGFPATQVASSDPNTLDDYEEGTFTPVVVGLTTAGVGTYALQAGRYTKTGNRVLISIAINWTGHTGTGGIAIAGLPFATNATSGVIPVFATYSNALTYTGELVAYAAPSQTQVTLGVNASGAPLDVVPMDTSAQLRISGHYEV